MTVKAEYTGEITMTKIKYFFRKLFRISKTIRSVKEREILSELEAENRK